jgi:hypothetical protein
MSRPASNPIADDDEVRGWIAEAGDFRVEPRPEHLGHVRQALLEHVGRPQEPVIDPEEAETPLGIGLIRILAAACLFAAVIAGAVYLMPRLGNEDWANIAQPLQDQRWIHCVATSPDGFHQETWFSPRFEILAMKSDNGTGKWDAEFHDLKANIKTEYVAEEDTLYRSSEGQQIRRNPSKELDFFHHLLNGNGFKTSPYPDTEIVSHTRRELVDQGGKKWDLHELTVRGLTNRDFQVKMTIRVDPATKLPRSWDVTGDDGTLYQVLDYPATWPADIRALGIPATAKLVDHIPADDLDQVLNRLHVGRDRFDDYCAYVWTDKWVNRVWRKGRRWRIELGTPRTTDPRVTFDPEQVPDDVELDWWNQHEPFILFRPEALCDGQTTWFYHYPLKSVIRNQMEAWEHKSVSTQYHYGTPDDRPVPWPHLMPEQIGHTHLVTNDPNWEFFVDLKPGDGPPNTLRLRVRDFHDEDSKLPDIYRLWIDPKKSDLVVRAESTILEPFSPSSVAGRPSEPVWNYDAGNGRFARRVRPMRPAPARSDEVETKVLEDLARSPGGFWYPTRVVRKSSKSREEQVIHFALDFDRPIPDDLFVPPR